MNARTLFIRLATSAAALSMIAVASSASADVVSDYPPAADARGFADSAGGWTGSVERSNVLCLPGVTCPQVTSFYVGAGGAAGADDGFLRSGVIGLGSLLTTTRVTWTSPTFLYNGAQAAQPDSVRLSFGARNDADALLTLLSDVEYTVLLDNLDLGAQTVIVDQDVPDAPAWAGGGNAAIAPGSLVLGDEYRIRLVTELEMPVALIPSGSFDLDDVVLRATKVATTPPVPPGGGAGDDGGGGGGGGGGTANNDGSGRAPRAIVASSLRGGFIYVKVKCAKRAEAKCKFKLTGRAKGRKSAKVTKAAKATAKPGKRKLMKLKVKARALPKVEVAKKLMFTGSVKAGSSKSKIAKRLKLRH